MFLKRFFPSAAFWFLTLAGVSFARPAEATGYFHFHYYQPYGQYYPHHYTPYYHDYHGRAHRHHFYSRRPGSYCPPRGFLHGYYQPLIPHGIGAAVTYGLYGHYYDDD